MVYEGILHLTLEAVDGQFIQSEDIRKRAVGR